MATETPVLNITIDPETLTWGDQLDLEDAKGLRSISAWLVKNGGVTDAEVRALPLKRLRQIMTDIRHALDAALGEESPN